MDQALLATVVTLWPRHCLPTVATLCRHTNYSNIYTTLCTVTDSKHFLKERHPTMPSAILLLHCSIRFLQVCRYTSSIREETSSTFTHCLASTRLPLQVWLLCVHELFIECGHNQCTFIRIQGKQDWMCYQSTSVLRHRVHRPTNAHFCYHNLC